MLFFSRKHKLAETPIFKGLTDYHNHTLPGVDDGVQQLEESLMVLSHFEQIGISEVVLTPHVMVGVNEKSHQINAAFSSLKRAYQGEIKLTLGSEYMLDSGFLNQIKNGEPRLIEKNNILVETSYFSAPYNLDELLYEICIEQINPIIAHPERYLYMPRSKYHTLHEREYKLQLNLLSFANLYGSKVSKNALYLLEHGLYSMMGTDLHNLAKFKRLIAEIRLSAKHIEMLLALKS
ncbi:MAG: CpsB/CapC family capsule biosynthesis tyrosine phosphatase [Rikenellaceae bacterium]